MVDPKQHEFASQYNGDGKGRVLPDTLYVDLGEGVRGLYHDGMIHLITPMSPRGIYLAPETFDALRRFVEGQQ